MLIDTCERDESGLRIYKLSERISIEICDEVWLHVPKGFRTNLATIPKPFRWLIKPSSLGRASIIHDFLLQENTRRRDKDAKPLCSRWMADSVLYEVMRRDDQSWLKSFAVLIAVRVFSLFAD